MDRTLHNANNAQRILELTADTMLLIDRNGICVDIDSHCDLWFLQEEVLLGKNVFELLPERTRDKVMPGRGAAGVRDGDRGTAKCQQKLQAGAEG